MLVVKIGGSKGINLDNIVKELIHLNEKIVLVHGASDELNELQQKLGIPLETYNLESGFESRKTDEKVLELFEMAYCGKMNKKIVEMLQAKGINAVGLSGIDGRIFEAKRNSAIRIKENEKIKLVKNDLSGRTEKVNAQLIKLLLDNNFVPVLTPPAISFDNKAVNVDGDFSAAVLAVELKADALLLLSNVSGLLENIDNENSLIKKISSKNIDSALDSAKGRMKKKVLAAKNAFEKGVQKVVIGSANIENPIKSALNGQGTVFLNE